MAFWLQKSKFGAKIDPKLIQHGSKIGLKRVQNGIKTDSEQHLPSSSPFWPPADPQVTPLGPPTCAKIVPKCVQKNSKLGQKWMPEINVDFYWFFVSFLIKNWSKNRCFFDDLLARALLQPTCENLPKTLKKTMVFDDFSGFERSKNVKKSIKNAS